VVAALGRDDLRVAQLDRRVGPQLLAPDAQQLARSNVVAREEAVQRAGSGVARVVVVAHQHAPATASQDQGRTEPGRPRADDDHVEQRAPSSMHGGLSARPHGEVNGQYPCHAASASVQPGNAMLLRVLWYPFNLRLR
jgi:hypothetical protein